MCEALYSNFLLTRLTKLSGSELDGKQVGQTIPSMFLDKWLEDVKEYDLNLFKPNSDACMRWLDAKVVYLSFGSLEPLEKHKWQNWHRV